jgi:DNA polymerase III gamma/tau subunit
MQFTVAPLGERQMVRLLKKIVESEKAIDFPQDAYQMIHKSSLGHVRDALQILEKIIDLPAARILKSIEEVASEESKLIELCQALLKQETWKSISKIIRELPEKEEPESMRRAILGYMTSVLLKADNPQAAICIDAFKEPFYNSGKAGLVLSCYEAVKS